MKLRKNKNALGASHKKSLRSDVRQMDMMAFPGFLLLLVFNYIPMFGIILAFKKYNPNIGILASEWIGFDNFKYFFMSNDFGMLMRNTVLYAIWFLVLTNFFDIVFAIMCYNIRNKAALKYYQTTAILPTFMSIVLISYIVYAFLSPSTGVLNNIIKSFGGDGIDWYTQPQYWPAILSVVKVWNAIGYGSLIYYATMVGIDESLFEAAEIDGANKWKQIIHIIIPEIMSLLCLKLIMGVGGIVGGDFGLHYQVTRNVGLLYPTTDILATYNFRALQEGTSMGRTTAIGLFQSVAGIILIVSVNFIIKRIDEEKSMF